MIEPTSPQVDEQTRVDASRGGDVLQNSERCTGMWTEQDCGQNRTVGSTGLYRIVGSETSGRAQFSSVLCKCGK
ncbi:Hypothetical predicted protein [Pelobates cultripes]|uniref:Uncharacterized protein n=1 Tax=Pelobates cultripes TaxID=61616 RepID=A0AAD1WFK2_PELCU|nr:Hypothetical predicted protein [Pelobates cultripes]